MAGEKTLKLKASLDVSEVTASANRAVADINRVQAAAQATNTGRGLASDPAAFFAAEEARMSASASAANPRAYGRDAAGVQLTALAKGTNRELDKTSQLLDRIGASIGGSILAPFINTFGVASDLVNLLRVIPGALGAGGVAVAGGAATSLAAAVYAINQFRELRRVQADTYGSMSGNNATTLNAIRNRVVAGRDSGTIRGGAGEDLLSDIDVLLKQRSIAKGNLAGGIIQRQIQEQLPGILRRARELTGENFASEEEMARDNAAALVAIDKTRLDTEQAQLRAALEAGQITQEQYAARRRGLVEEETAGQRRLLDLQESQLRAKLGRQGNDPEGAVTTRNDLQRLANQRQLLDATELRDLELVDGERTNVGRRGRSRPLTLFERLSGGGDAGLRSLGTRASGGGGAPAIEMQQLEELRRLNSNFSGLPGGIAEKL